MGAGPVLMRDGSQWRGRADDSKCDAVEVAFPGYLTVRGEEAAGGCGTQDLICLWGVTGQSVGT